MTQKQTGHSTPKQSAQQHNQQAGEQAGQASKGHKEATKLHGAGDHSATDQQAKIAQDRGEQAGQHVSDASKKNNSGSSTQQK